MTTSHLLRSPHPAQCGQEQAGTHGGGGHVACGCVPVAAARLLVPRALRAKKVEADEGQQRCVVQLR